MKNHIRVISLIGIITLIWNRAFWLDVASRILAGSSNQSESDFRSRLPTYACLHHFMILAPVNHLRSNRIDRSILV